MVLKKRFIESFVIYLNWTTENLWLQQLAHLADMIIDRWPLISTFWGLDRKIMKAMDAKTNLSLDWHWQNFNIVPNLGRKNSKYLVSPFLKLFLGDGRAIKRGNTLVHPRATPCQVQLFRCCGLEANTLRAHCGPQSTTSAMMDSNPCHSSKHSRITALQAFKMTGSLLSRYQYYCQIFRYMLKA